MPHVRVTHVPSLCTAPVSCGHHFLFSLCLCSLPGMNLPGFFSTNGNVHSLCDGDGINVSYFVFDIPSFISCCSFSCSLSICLSASSLSLSFPPGAQLWNCDWAHDAVSVWVRPPSEQEDPGNQFSFEAQPISGGAMRVGFLRHHVAARDPAAGTGSEALDGGQHLGQDQQSYALEGNGCLYFEGRRLRKREARFVGTQEEATGPTLGCVANAQEFVCVLCISSLFFSLLFFFVVSLQQL